MMNNGYMNDWQWGFGMGHWGYGVLLWAVVIVVVVVAAQNIFKRK